MMGASLLFYVFVLDGYLRFWEGVIFIALLICFMVWTIRKSRKEFSSFSEEVRPAKISIPKAVFLIVLASLGLYFGANMLVESAKSIALDFGVSERVIGLTLVAFGTSVPELATSAVAALKKEMDISVGNIIGSNIFNLLGVLGVTSTVHSIHVGDRMISFDILWMLAISFLLFLLILPLRKAKLHRWKGILLLMVYLSYVYLVFFR
jgi:cation:H+ antiporter